jgi:hypothetical protein
MPSTYLELCNLTLRRLNEVEIAADDFSSIRGVQALVKDAVKSAVAKINQAEFEWPFNAAQETDTLIVGQEEYAWPSFFKAVDWNSFQIQKDDSLGTSYKTLSYKDRDDWLKNFRDTDMNSGSTGRGIPDFVFSAHGNGYGVTPSPDKAYSIRFNYFLNFTDINLSTDVTRIPESHDSVLIDGALYYMYMFKDNTEAAQVAYGAFEKGIKDLQTLYINNTASIRDTRIRF